MLTEAEVAAICNRLISEPVEPWTQDCLCSEYTCPCHHNLPRVLLDRRRLLILLAVEAGEVSLSCAAKALGVDIVTLREWRHVAVGQVVRSLLPPAG